MYEASVWQDKWKGSMVGQLQEFMTQHVHVIYHLHNRHPHVTLELEI